MILVTEHPIEVTVPDPAGETSSNEVDSTGAKHDIDTTMQDVATMDTVHERGAKILDGSTSIFDRIHTHLEFDAFAPFSQEQECHWNDRWIRYLERENQTNLWTMRHETEQERYRAVLEELQRNEAQQKMQGDAIVEQHVGLTVRNRGRVRRIGNQDELDTIHAAANKVEMHKANQLTQQNLTEHRLKVMKRVAGGACGIKRVWLGPAREEGSQELEIATTLVDKPYYLGHHGGDYVFRYRHIERPDPQEGYGSSSLNSGEWDRDMPVWEYPSSDIGLGAREQETAKEDFTYCGLVPRTWKEHAARFKIVCADVLRLFASVTQFQPDGNGPLRRTNVAQIDHDFDAIRATTIVYFRNEWYRTVYKDYSVLSWVQEKAKTHTRFLEFGYLLTQLSNRSHGLFRVQMTTLVNMVEEATDMKLSELKDAHERCIKEEALHQLCDVKNIQHCAVYENDSNEVSQDTKFQLPHLAKPHPPIVARDYLNPTLHPPGVSRLQNLATES